MYSSPVALVEHLLGSHRLPSYLGYLPAPGWIGKQMSVVCKGKPVVLEELERMGANDYDVPTQRAAFFLFY